MPDDDPVGKEDLSPSSLLARCVGCGDSRRWAAQSTFRSAHRRPRIANWRRKTEATQVLIRNARMGGAGRSAENGQDRQSAEAMQLGGHTGSISFQGSAL